MLFVNLLRVALAIKVLEVLVRAPDDVGEFQIFQYGRHEADRLMSVCLAEIGIVIDDRFPVVMWLSSMKSRIMSPTRSLPSSLIKDTGTFNRPNDINPLKTEPPGTAFCGWSFLKMISRMVSPIPKTFLMTIYWFVIRSCLAHGSWSLSSPRDGA